MQEDCKMKFSLAKNDEACQRILGEYKNQITIQPGFGPRTTARKAIGEINLNRKVAIEF